MESVSEVAVSAGGILVMVAGTLFMVIGWARHRTNSVVVRRLASVTLPETGREGEHDLSRWWLPRSIFGLMVRAGVEVEGRKWLWFAFLGLCGLLVLAAVAGFAVTLLLLVAMLALTYILLERRARQRIEKLLEALPEILDQMRQGLAAGHDPGAAFIRALEGRDSDVRQLLAGAVARMRLGGSLAESFEVAYEHLALHDLQLLATLFALHERFGGSLGSTLSNTIATLRDRARINQEFRALSSETRTSAKVLASLPPLIAAITLAMKPDHLDFFLSGQGRAIGAIGAAVYLCGLLVLRHVTRVRY